MRNKLIIAIVVVVVVGIGASLVWSRQGADSLAKLAAQPGAKVSGDQVNQLVARIGQFITVPSGEQPSVVVLQNVAELAKQQTFYQNAKDGDILLLFSNRAIIYDAIANKLVNVGPIVRNDATPLPTEVASASASVSPSVSATPGVPEKVAVMVLNGTSKQGYAAATALELGKNSWVTKATAHAAVGNYSKTLIIDQTGKYPNDDAWLANKYNGTVQDTLPKVEVSLVPSTVGVVVILGQ